MPRLGSGRRALIFSRSRLVGYNIRLGWRDERQPFLFAMLDRSVTETADTGGALRGIAQKYRVSILALTPAVVASGNQVMMEQLRWLILFSRTPMKFATR
jgi:hypothetical protein